MSDLAAYALTAVLIGVAFVIARAAARRAARRRPDDEDRQP